MSLSLFIDGLIVVLLAVTIFYGVVLGRRLTALRQSEGEMRAKLDEFNTAAARAEASFAGLRGRAPSANTGVSEVLDPKMLEQAELLRDDLMFLTERGEALAGRLETIAQGTAGTPAKGETAPSPTLGRALKRAASGGPQKSSPDNEDSPAENAGAKLLQLLGHARAGG